MIRQHVNDRQAVLGCGREVGRVEGIADNVAVPILAIHAGARVIEMLPRTTGQPRLIERNQRAPEFFIASHHETGHQFDCGIIRSVDAQESRSQIAVGGRIDIDVMIAFRARVPLFAG